MIVKLGNDKIVSEGYFKKVYKYVFSLFFSKTKMPITSEPLNLFEQTKIYIIAQDLGYNILKGLNLIFFRHGII